MTIDLDTFRSVLGRFASGVTVITVLDAGGRDMGMTVSAFASVSLEPPLVSVCIDHAASMYAALRDARRFGVNILSSEQEALSRRFSGVESAHRFDGIGYERGESGVVLLDDVVAHMECERVAQHDAGDHTLFIGQVERAIVHDARPLLYYRGGYARLER